MGYSVPNPGSKYYRSYNSLPIVERKLCTSCSFSLNYIYNNPIHSLALIYKSNPAEFKTRASPNTLNIEADLFLLQ